MTTIRYIARRDFEYGGKQVRRGDEIEPQGGKWDHKIFMPDSGFVTVVRETEKQPARRRRTKNAS